MNQPLFLMDRTFGTVFFRLTKHVQRSGVVVMQVVLRLEGCSVSSNIALASGGGMLLPDALATSLHRDPSASVVVVVLRLCFL